MPTECPYCHHVNRDSAHFCGMCRGLLAQSSPTGTSAAPYGSPPVAGPSQTGLLQPNTLLAGRYLVLRKIGQGGFGAVYQASDARLPGKLWAVKEMSDAAITDPTEKRRAIAAFRREAQILATLKHPNIPTVIDFFSYADRHYLVMEYVDGETLENLLAAQGHTFTEAEVWSWLDQLCQALTYLHSCQPPVIFRDLKPQNIMLDRGGQIKLIDFGIARLLQVGKTKDTAQLGTAGYAPPEQYGHGQTDARSDIYALGATLHRLLTCHDPTATPFNLPPVRQLNPAVSSTIERIINRALEQDPQKRWQSVHEIQTVLRSSPPPVMKAGTTTVSSTSSGVMGPVSSAHSPRPTTRLLLTVAEMSNEQLAITVGGLVILVALGIWLLAPMVQQNLPFVWNNTPAFVIAGPMAYAAARRRGAAILSHLSVIGAGWLAWWSRIGYTPHSYWPLLVGALISGLVIEGGLAFLPQVRGRAGDEAWKREIAWFVLLAILAAVSFYTSLDGVLGLKHSMRLELWIGAATLGAVGWFLGDLVQEWLISRQTGTRRVTRI